MDYQERFYRDVFFPYLKAMDIKNIFHLGDYYDHRKNINFKALHHNRKIFLEPLTEMGIHMDIIPGNHDTFYKNTNDRFSSLIQGIRWTPFTLVGLVIIVTLAV